jgi:transcriptional regulator with XRE-family HTH domain
MKIAPGVALRLQRALSLRERSIRSLHLELHAEGVRGSSYASVHGYLNGRANPPLEFLLASAEALGIDPRWLIEGVGQPTDTYAAGDEAISDAGEATAWTAVQELGHEADWAELRQRVKQALQEEFIFFGELPPLAAAAVWRTWERLAAEAAHQAEWIRGDGADGRAESTERALTVARDVGLCLMAPFSVLDVRPSDLRRWQVESYVLGICSALSSLIADPNATEPMFQPF